MVLRVGSLSSRRTHKRAIISQILTTTAAAVNTGFSYGLTSKPAGRRFSCCSGHNCNEHGGTRCHCVQTSERPSPAGAVAPATTTASSPATGLSFSAAIPVGAPTAAVAASTATTGAAASPPVFTLTTTYSSSPGAEQMNAARKACTHQCNSNNTAEICTQQSDNNNTFTAMSDHPR